MFGILLDGVNLLISAVGAVLVAVINLLPQSPFNWDMSAATGFMGLFFWLVPVPAILSVIALWIPAVGVYYGLRVLLRQIKMAGD